MPFFVTISASTLGSPKIILNGLCSKKKKIIRTKHRSKTMVIYLLFAFGCAAVCLLFVLLIAPDFPVKNQS